MVETKGSSDVFETKGSSGVRNLNVQVMCSKPIDYQQVCSSVERTIREEIPPPHRTALVHRSQHAKLCF